jgi:anti-sigma B factor antagonist
MAGAARPEGARRVASGAKALRQESNAATSPHAMPAPNPTTGILTLEGEIDLHRSPEIKETLRPLIEQKVPRIFIDMSAVNYIDSSGLAIFIEALQRVMSYGGKFGLFGLRESVRSIFEIARLDQVFQISPTKLPPRRPGSTSSPD